MYTKKSSGVHALFFMESALSLLLSLRGAGALVRLCAGACSLVCSAPAWVRTYLIALVLLVKSVPACVRMIAYTQIGWFS
jgi:hypothetical protein